MQSKDSSCQLVLWGSLDTQKPVCTLRYLTAMEHLQGPQKLGQLNIMHCR